MPDQGVVNVLRSRFQGYSGARPDVVRLISPDVRVVLDVGCGAGITADLIRSRSHNVVKIIGVEPSSELIDHAKERLDEVINGPIDDARILSRLASMAPFDAIICADVLEHLINPLDTLKALSGLLDRRGELITSIPNVRHWSTFTSLGLLGTWPARERGIHDRTHLRFFARRDIVALGRAAGYTLERERRNLRLIEAAAWTGAPAKALDFWPFRPFLTFQYLHKWRLTGAT